MGEFTKSQKAAIKKLNAAFLICKRAGLVFTGSDDSVLCTVEDEEFIEACMRGSTSEAMRKRCNQRHPLSETIKDYGCYRCSGGA